MPPTLLCANTFLAREGAPLPNCAIHIEDDRISRCALFPLGDTAVTPAAGKALTAFGILANDLFLRHQTGDFGTLGFSEAREAAIRKGWRVFSAYVLPDGTDVWIVTEGERHHTACLFPREYGHPEQNRAGTAGIPGRLVTSADRRPFRLEKWRGGRAWAVYRPSGDLVCVCLYKKGGQEVIRLLSNG